MCQNGGFAKSVQLGITDVTFGVDFHFIRVADCAEMRFLIGIQSRADDASF